MMLSKSSLIAFVASQDPAHARTFYENVLGLRLIEDEPFALVFDAHGTMLRVQKVQSVSPAAYTALGWEVDDIRAEIDSLGSHGVICEIFEGLAQDENGICSFQDGTQVAWFKDFDGNLLSLTQFP